MARTADSSISFVLDGKELRDADEFFESHDCGWKTTEASVGIGTSDRKYFGAAGGGRSFKFSPTGLGVCVQVSCACGAKKDVTDIDSW